MNSNKKWSISLHEAAHAVAARALGCRPKLLTIDPGICLHSEPNDLWEAAVIAAAGEAGEDELEQIEPPTRVTSQTNPDKPGIHREPLVASILNFPRETLSDVSSDDRAVAWYAFAGPHTEWTSRANQIHHVARGLVLANTGAIISLAILLYESPDGVLTKEDLNKLLT